MNLEYGVEYLPNDAEDTQWQELTELQFLDLLKSHKKRGYTVNMDYESFTVSLSRPDAMEGRSGKRLTIYDDWGIYYG